MEIHIQKLDRDHRLVLPQPLIEKVNWITGTQALSAWLLLGNSARCRLLSLAAVDEDRDLQLLQAKIASELEVQKLSKSKLEFHDEILVASTFRLLSVQITPPDPGWRLKLPRPIAAIMQLRPGQSEVAELFVQDHIELWTIETLRSSVDIPLSQII